MLSGGLFIRDISPSYSTSCHLWLPPQALASRKGDSRHSILPYPTPRPPADSLLDVITFLVGFGVFSASPPETIHHPVASGIPPIPDTAKTKSVNEVCIPYNTAIIPNHLWTS